MQEYTKITHRHSLATHRAGESEPGPTSGSTSGTTSGPTSGPTSAPTRSPTRAPTTGPTRVYFACFRPSKDSYSRVFLNLWFAKPMVCVRVVFHENDGNHGNDENDEDSSDSYKQGVERWIRGNHGNHENDENHRNPGCKPRVPQTTGLETPNTQGLPRDVPRSDPPPFARFFWHLGPGLWAREASVRGGLVPNSWKQEMKAMSFLSLLVWISLVNFKEGISLLKLEGKELGP